MSCYTDTSSRVSSIEVAVKVHAETLINFEFTLSNQLKVIKVANTLPILQLSYVYRYI